MTLKDPELLHLLADGRIGVIPTDTVYGLVCLATDEIAVKRFYDLKKRDAKPGTIIAASVEQLVDLGLKERYLKPVAHYWPNPISIVIPCGPELSYLHLGKLSLAVRIPNDHDLRQVLSKAGPLLTSSANKPGEPPTETIQEITKQFPGLDFYVDGGDLKGHESSTVIRIVDDAVEVLRKGAVTINEAGEVVK